MLATQNPREFEGTYPLPESQLDRFMLRIDLGYPARESEAAMIARYGATMGRPPSRTRRSRSARASSSSGARRRRRPYTSRTRWSATCSTSRARRASNAQIALGLSTRGVLALIRAARIEAALRGADFATPDDVKAVAPMVIAHRLVLTPEAALDGYRADRAGQRMLEQVPVPR